MKKIKELFTKYYDIITYLFFGVLTTVINYMVYIPCYNWLHLSATVSNVIAWVIAVAFAYLSMNTVVPELGKFLGCRIGSGVMETLIILLTVDCLHWNGNVMKLFTNVLVVIVNYIGSKLLVFTEKKK